MTMNRINQLLVLAFFVGSLYVSANSESENSEYNGIKISAYYSILNELKFKLYEKTSSGETVRVLQDDEKEKTIKVSCRVFLENVNEENIIVVTNDRNGDEKTTRKNKTFGLYILSLNRDHLGRVIKPSLQKFNPVELKLGEVTELPGFTLVLKDDSDIGKLRVYYRIEQAFGDLFGVWSGDLETEIVEMPYY